MTVVCNYDQYIQAHVQDARQHATFSLHACPSLYFQWPSRLVEWQPAKNFRINEQMSKDSFYREARNLLYNVNLLATFLGCHQDRTLHFASRLRRMQLYSTDYESDLIESGGSGPRSAACPKFPAL